MIETLWSHRRIAFNPRFGRLGLVAFPYFILFELAGPAIELIGYPALVGAALAGRLSVEFYVAFFVIAILVGALLSVSALMLEEFSFRRYTRGREVARLVGAALIENVGYRQLNTVWRVLGLVDVARGRRGWGEMQRRGLGYAPARSSPPGR